MAPRCTLATLALHTLQLAMTTASHAASRQCSTAGGLGEGASSLLQFPVRLTEEMNMVSADEEEDESHQHDARPKAPPGPPPPKGRREQKQTETFSRYEAVGPGFVIAETPCAFGVEIEFHTMKLEGKSQAVKKVLGEGKPQLAETAWPGPFPERRFGSHIPGLAYVVDHFRNDAIIEAVFAPFPVTKSGIALLEDLVDRHDALIDHLIEDGKMDLDKFVKLADARVLSQLKVDKLLPKAESCQGDGLCQIEVMANLKISDRDKELVQINFHLALSRVPDLWRLISQTIPRIIAYASVEVAKELVQDFGTCKHSSFVGILSQFLIRCFYAPKLLSQKYDDKNRPGILLKAYLQEMLSAATRQFKKASFSRWNGPVQPTDVHSFAKKWQGMDGMETWAEKMVEKVKEVLKGQPDEVFDQQASFKWIMKATGKHRDLTEADALKPSSSNVLQLVVGHLEEESKEQIATEMKSKFSALFQYNPATNSMLSFTAGLRPFYSQQEAEKGEKKDAALCVLAETRFRSDMPTVLLKQGLTDELVDLLEYMGRDPDPST